MAGDLADDGYCLSIWRGRCRRDQRLDVDLSRSAAVFALSLAGATKLGGIIADDEKILGAEQALMLNGAARPVWLASGGHRLLILEVTQEAIKIMGGGMPLRTEVEGLLEAADGQMLGPFEVGQDVLSLAQQLTQPPSHLVSLPVWYRAKVMELAALSFYCLGEQKMGNEGNGSMDRERSARELVQRATFLLERDLENPPGLEILAEELGCNAFQLSRFFSAEVGCSMPQYLRRKRMERAAALLHSTRLGVSEVSLAVGYTSFSAFTRAFVREHGETPTGFRHKTG